MNKHKAKQQKARATLNKLKRQNDLLRRALIAERFFWRHLLECSECHALLRTSPLCPVGYTLRARYLSQAHEAFLKSNLKSNLKSKK